MKLPFVIFLSCLLLFSFTLSPSQNVPEKVSVKTQEKKSTPSCVKTHRHDFGNETEIRFAYFHPRANSFRKIYKGKRIDYQIETCQRLPMHFFLWANGSWFPKSRQIDADHHSRINLVTVSLGPKYQFRLHPCLYLSLGIGPAYYFLYIKDQSPCELAKTNIHHDGWGAAFKTQLQCFFYHGVYADFFVDYLYEPLNAGEECVSQVGGFKVGLGLGKHF
jgi:hypothetical protein